MQLFAFSFLAFLLLLLGQGAFAAPTATLTHETWVCLLHDLLPKDGPLLNIHSEPASPRTT